MNKNDSKYIYDSIFGSEFHNLSKLETEDLQNCNRKQIPTLGFDDAYVNNEPEFTIGRILIDLLSDHSELSKRGEDYNIIERYLHQVIECCVP